MNVKFNKTKEVSCLGTKPKGESSTSFHQDIVEDKTLQDLT